MTTEEIKEIKQIILSSDIDSKMNTILWGILIRIISKQEPKATMKSGKKVLCGSCCHNLTPSERERPFCSQCGQRIERSWEKIIKE